MKIYRNDSIIIYSVSIVKEGTPEQGVYPIQIKGESMSKLKALGTSLGKLIADTANKVEEVSTSTSSKAKQAYIAAIEGVEAIEEAYHKTRVKKAKSPETSEQTFKASLKKSSKKTK